MLRAKKFSLIKNREFYKFLKGLHIDHRDSTDEKCETIILYTYYISFYYLDYFCYDFIKNKTFSINNVAFDYTIQKEIYTDTWMFTCDKLIVVYIKPDDIEEFSLSYMFSSIYRFVIYETYNGYIAISISHTTDDIDDVLRFNIMNLSNPKYILMSYFLKNNTQIQDGENLKDDQIQDDQIQDDQIQDDQIQDDQIQDLSEISLDYFKNVFNIRSFIILNRNIQSVLDEDFKDTNDLYKLYDIIGYGNINQELYKFVNFVLAYVKVFKNYPVSYLPI
jgi:hypothetical protein